MAARTTGRAGAWLALLVAFGAPFGGACAGCEDAPCAAPRALCGGDCVDLASDPASCGECGRACEGAEICVGGVCVAACPEGRSACGGECVDFTDSHEHCGACGHACPTTKLCSVGECSEPCDPPLFVCGNACVDLLFDPQNCGGCGAACRENEACVTGYCMCYGTTCGGDCVDLQFDPENCGSCGHACAPAEGCYLGACAVGCYTICDTGCVDLSNDPEHCGACDRACAADEVCLDGACLPCPAGTSPCGAGCVDLSSDPSSCGYCGKVCGAAQTCTAGACAGPCVEEDPAEDNDTQASATPISWDQSFPQGLVAYQPAFLCGGDEDWYLADTSSVALFSPVLQVDLTVKDAEASGCACDCDSCPLELPPGPHHTVRVELYGAETLAMVGATASPRGVAHLVLFGPELAAGVFIRVNAPPEAEYPYVLHVLYQEQQIPDD